MAIETESRTALHELIGLLQEVDERWAGEEWNLFSAEDVTGAHRSLMHMLEGGLMGHFEYDPARPDFRRIVSPSRKFTGDNGDAIYFDAPISPEYSYVVTGNMHGAVYFSMTLEVGTASGSMGSKTDGVINDTTMDVAGDGSFEIYLGGEPRQRNWIPINSGVDRVTTRHYFEEETCAASDPGREPTMSIEAVGQLPKAANIDDGSVATGIRRVAEFVRSRTLGMPPMANAVQPPFVSIVPNQFPTPVVPGDFGLAAFDAHYSMAPYYLGPDEALVMSAKWPNCRFANVCLWTRFQQTFDYTSRQTSLNRVQAEADSDGNVKIVIAHQDPGVPNWLDTEGRALGLVFWRYMLAEGDVVTPTAEVVKLADLI